MADNIKADHVADVHDMVVDNTQSGSDNDVTRKHSLTEVEDIAPVIAKIRGGYDKRHAKLTKLEAEL